MASRSVSTSPVTSNPVTSRRSRYRSVPEVTAPDTHGRLLVAKDSRPLPEVTGTFRHRVVAGDRLDRLAAVYYGKPLLWWRICDANPAFLSPLELLGADPIVTTVVPITGDVPEPPWAGLVRRLTELAGVSSVRVVDDVELVVQGRAVGGGTPTDVEQRPVRSVEVTHNRVEVTTVTILDTVEAALGPAGLRTGKAVELGQIGQEIVIPPAVG
jgi:hypothetical protein